MDEFAVDLKSEPEHDFHFPASCLVSGDPRYTAPHVDEMNFWGIAILPEFNEKIEKYWIVS